MISECMVHSVLEIDSISKWTEMGEFPVDPRYVGVPSIVPKMISKPMVCLAQTVHLSCVGLTLSPN
jgi:hypothetical protein